MIDMVVFFSDSYDNIHINTNVSESHDLDSPPSNLIPKRRNSDYQHFPSISSSFHSVQSHPMQSSASASSFATIGAGIVSPSAHLPHSPHLMQSTTPSVANGKDEMRGWLYKWTNVKIVPFLFTFSSTEEKNDFSYLFQYLKGYQKRWFVLQAGILYYYRSQDEMTHTCRGTVYLESAHLSSEESCHFVISNGSTVIHLRTSNETDKQRWMSALELAKQKAMKARKQYQESDEEISTTDETKSPVPAPLATANTSADATKSSNNSSERAELAAMNKVFDAKLEDLKTCLDLITRHCQALHRTLGDLEQVDKTDTTTSILKTVTERATLFRITSTGSIE